MPVTITTGAGGETRYQYNRSLETSVKFDHLGRQVEDMTAPLTAIGADLRTQVEMAFATEGASGASGRWRVLSEPYGSWKQKHAPGTPLLVGVRPLKRGSRSHPNRPQSYAPSGQMRRELLDPLATHITPRRLLYAPTSDIAGYHELGTDRMPARPPVDLTPTFLHSVDRHFAVWLDALMVRAGLAGPGSG